MTDEKIKVGDIVQLKHGGQIMTVTSVEPDMGGEVRAWCSYQNPKGFFPIRDFPLEALRKPSKTIIRSHAFKSWFGMILGALRKGS
jgi:uncharacterized protein YodC (DUF2158 family)